MKAADINQAAASLVTEIRTIKAVIAALDEKREEVSFDALATDNVEARKALEKIHRDRAGKQLELEDLELALAASKRRIAEAQRAASEETLRQRAELASPIAARLEARGKAMDDALKVYVENFRALEAEFDELARLGVPVPSRALIKVNKSRAHDAALAPTGDPNMRPVPPLQRHSFEKLLRDWVQPARRWIDDKINAAAKAA